MSGEGFCQCGCGQKTRPQNTSNKRLGWRAGEPRKFVNGHQSRKQHHSQWKGGIKINSQGYVMVLRPEHPRADVKGYVREHILIAEKTLEKPLPEGAIVHHSNGNRADNLPENLVICQDEAYHKFLHKRIRAYKACGHAKWLRCRFCGQWDDPVYMYVEPMRLRGYHRDCRNKHYREQKAITDMAAQE